MNNIDKMDELPGFMPTHRRTSFKLFRNERHFIYNGGKGWKRMTKADTQFTAKDRQPKMSVMVCDSPACPDQGDYNWKRGQRVYTYGELMADKYTKEQRTAPPWRLTKEERKSIKPVAMEAEQMYEASVRAYKKAAPEVMVPSEPRIGNRAKAKARNEERAKAAAAKSIEVKKLVRLFKAIDMLATILAGHKVYRY